jgi:hypothetical protein
MQNEIETFEVRSITFVKWDFESELQVLHMCMMVDVLIILAPFLSFAFVYNFNKVHIMLVPMLNFLFNSLDCVKALVQKAKVIELVVEYDDKPLMQLFASWFSVL